MKTTSELKRPGRHAMTIFINSWILGLLVFTSTQLASPTDSSNMAACSHNTCMWVPATTQKAFQNGDLSYAVETPGTNGSPEFVLRRADKELLRTPLKGLSGSVSAVWSPDHRSVAVTWGDKDGLGGFHVRAFKVDSSRVVELPVENSAFGDFKRKHWCATRGDNIQAFGWLSDSKRLVLVTSVSQASDCGPEMGYTEGYVVHAASGEILERWTTNQLNDYIHLHPEQ